MAGARVRPLSVSGRPKPFASGLPDVTAFPCAAWSRLTARLWRRTPTDLLSYGDPAGYRPLRAAIAAHIRAARAVRCEPDQVVITTGSQQALDLAARVLIEPRDLVLVEDPGYPGARLAFEAAGARIMALPVDAQGANVDRLPPTAAAGRVAVVTPSHQFPVGVTMSITRRLSLLDWARRARAWIIEDDYDSEFQYRGKPLPSLQGLDDDGRVIYMGSFSKTLFPSLRLGFVVLPAALVDSFCRMRLVLDGHSPVIDQAVLAEFIASGEFSRHVRRMRKLYFARQTALVQAIHRYLDGRLRVESRSGGLHLVGWLPEGASDRAVAARAERSGVAVTPLSVCSLKAQESRGLLLGFAPFTERQIRDGIIRLGQTLERA